MKETLKKIISFQLLFSYAVIITPAENFNFYSKRENQEDFLKNEMMRFEDRIDQYQNKIEGNNIQYENDSMETEYGTSELNNVDVQFLIHKTQLYKTILEIKNEMKKDLNTIDCEAELNKRWNERVNEVLSDFLKGNSLIENSDSFELVSMEQEIYNQLLNEYLYDQYSLRKNSDEKAAEIIADKMISDINRTTKTNFDSIFENINADIQNKEVADIQISKNEWLETFSNELDKGLKLWEDAERDYLTLKANWEKNAGESFIKDLSDWEAGYEKLIDNRNQWNENIKERIKDGLELWNSRELLADVELKDELHSFEVSLKEKYEQKRLLLKSNETMILQLENLIETTNEGIELWFTQWGEKYNGLYSYWKTESTTENFIEEIKKYISETANNRSVNNSFNTLLTWVQSNKRYTELKNKYSESYRNEVNKLSKELYESEEIKSETEKIAVLEKYWNERVLIDSAVYEYSINKTSSVETMGETERNYEKAKEDYENEKRIYEKDLEELKKEEQNYLEYKRLYENQQEYVSRLLTEYQILQNELNKVKFEVTDTLLEEIKQDVIRNVNELNSIETSYACVKNEYYNFADKLIKNEYKNIYESGSQICEILEQEQKVNIDETEECIESLENLKVTIEYNKQNNLDYSAELAQLEGRQSIIDFIKTGEIDESLYTTKIDFEKIKTEYGKYSLNYVKKADENLIRRIVETFNKERKIDDNSYREIVNELSDEPHSLFIDKLIEIYIEQNKKASFLENTETIEKELQVLFDNEIKINKKNLNLETVENVFKDIDLANYDSSETASYDNENLYIFENEKKYEGIFNKLIASIDELKAFNEKYIDYNQALESINAELNEARLKYINESEKLDANNESGLYAGLLSSYETYKKKYELTSITLNNVNQKLLEFNIAEKIMDWAREEYLHINSENLKIISPAERLEKDRQQQNNCKQISEILNNFSEVKLTVEDEKILSEYENLTNDMFVFNSIYSDLGNRLNSQKEKAVMSKSEEFKMLGELVKESDYADYESVEFSKLVSDYIVVEKIENGDGSSLYSFHLALNDVPTSYNHSTLISDECKEKNKELIKEYLLTKNVVQYDVDGKEYLFTSSVCDALDFLISLENKNYNIDDLLLSVCYLKSKSSENDLFFENEDPENDSNYPLAIPTKNLFGMNFESNYHSGRKDEVESAFYKVLNNGGLDDIAKFIFYSNYNIKNEAELKNREIDVIAYRGLQKVIDEVTREANGYTTSGIALAASAAVMAATAAIPIIGAWAIAPSAALAIASAACFINAASLNECNSDIKNIQSGYSEILNEYRDNTNSLIYRYLKAKNQTEQETEKYFRMLYGCEVPDSEKYSYENFEKSVNEIYGQNDFLYNLKNKDGEKIDLEKLFYELNQKFEIKNTVDGIIALKDYFYQQFSELSVKLNEYVYQRDAVHNENIQKLDALFKNLMPESDDCKLSKNIVEELMEDCFGENSWNKNLFVSRINDVYIQTHLNDTLLFPGQKLNSEQIFSQIELSNDFLTDNSISIQMDGKNFEHDLFLADLSHKKNTWLESMNYAYKCGNEEWSKAQNKYDSNFVDWKQNWEKEYSEKEKKFNLAYQDLLKEKTDWVNNQYIKGVVVSSPDELINQTLNDAEKIQSQMKKSDIGFNADLVDTGLLDLLGRNYISLDDSVFNKTILQLSDNLESLDDYVQKTNITKQIEMYEKEITDKAAEYAALMAEGLLSKEVDNINSLVNEQNEKLTKWENDLVRKDGYTVGNEIYRNAIVDSLIGQVAVRERQTVHKYQWFTFADPFINRCQNFRNLDSSSINILLNRSFSELDSWYEKIFGSETSEGEFTKHVGEAPVFVENIDTSKSRFENISKNGSGEMGLIMLDYIWNSVVNSEGYGQLGTPLYDKKITRDNKVLGIQLPTIRDISQIVCDIVANGTGQKWFSFFDDVVYGIMDASFQTKSTGEIFAGLGKAVASYGLGAASSAATNAISGISNAAVNTLLNTAVKTSTAYITSAANSYIDSIDFNNGFKIDWERANQVWSDSEVIENSVGTGLSYSVNTTLNYKLNKLNLTDGLGQQLNSEVFNTAGISALNRTVATLAGAGAEAIVTGKFNLNVLSTKDLGLNLDSDLGLFNVSIDKNGVNASVSENGNLIGIKQLISGIGGIKDSSKIINAKAESKNGNIKDLITLNAINALGNSSISENLELAKRIWNNNIKVKYEELKDDELGYYDKENPDSINVNSKYLANNFVSNAELAAVLSHEGSHLDGNDIEAMSQAMGLNTYINLCSLYDIELNQDLMFEMIDSYTDEDNWNPSEGNIEWWKLSSNGTLSFDKDGWLKDENNKYIYDINGNKIGSNGILTGLLNILYQQQDGVFTWKNYEDFSDEQIAFAKELMLDAGLTYDSETGMYTNNISGKKLDTDKIMQNCGSTVADAVFKNYYDTAVDSWIATQKGIDLGINHDKHFYADCYDRIEKIYNESLETNKSAAALLDKYKFSLTKKNGEDIKLFKIDNTNPFTDDLMKQYAVLLDKQINKTGCCFMSVLAVPQLLTGEILDYRQVSEIWDLARKDGCVGNDATVKDADKLSNIVLNYMGIKDFGLTYYNKYEGKTLKNKKLIGERIQVEFGSTGHFTVGNASDNILYNPHVTVNQIKRRDGVFIYAK